VDAVAFLVALGQRVSDVELSVEEKNKNKKEAKVRIKRRRKKQEARRRPAQLARGRDCESMGVY
jgi:hypothetical protein